MKSSMSKEQSGEPVWFSKRSTYILEGASSKLEKPEAPVPMELLYLLLPIIGAFLLLFSVCCCGKTLKKMLHIPKEVVLSRYAVMQMQHHSATSSDSSEDSSSSDAEEEEPPNLQEEPRNQHREEEPLSTKHSEESQNHRNAQSHHQIEECQSQVEASKLHEIGAPYHQVEKEEHCKSHQENNHKRETDTRTHVQEGNQSHQIVLEIQETSSNSDEDTNTNLEGSVVTAECGQNIDESTSDDGNDEPVSIVVIPRCDITGNNGTELDSRNCDTSYVGKSPSDTSTNAHRNCQCKGKRKCSNQNISRVSRHAKSSCQCKYANHRDRVELNNGRFKNCQCVRGLTGKNIGYRPLEHPTDPHRKCHNVDKVKSKPSKLLNTVKGLENHSHKRLKCPHKRSASRDHRCMSHDQKGMSRDCLHRETSQSCPLLTMDAMPPVDPI